MRNASLWRAVLGVEKTVVEGLEFDDHEQLLIAHVRPKQVAAIGMSCSLNTAQIGSTPKQSR